MVQITAAARERRREILAAASRVFRRDGLHAAGMREVAAELGMTAGNLYYYFDSKQALLAFCQEDALAGLHATLRRIKALEVPADTALALAIVGHVVRLNEGTPGSLAHLEVEALEGERREEILARRNAYERGLRRLVAKGVEAGIFRPGLDPRTSIFALLGAVNWTVKWFQSSRSHGSRPSRTARELGAEFAELLVRGLLAAGREPRLPSAAMVDTILREDDDAS